VPAASRSLRFLKTSAALVLSCNLLAGCADRGVVTKDPPSGRVQAIQFDSRCTLSGSVASIRLVARPARTGLGSGTLRFVGHWTVSVFDSEGKQLVVESTSALSDGSLVIRVSGQTDPARLSLTSLFATDQPLHIAADSLSALSGSQATPNILVSSASRTRDHVDLTLEVTEEPPEGLILAGIDQLGLKIGATRFLDTRSSGSDVPGGWLYRSRLAPADRGRSAMGTARLSARGLVVETTAPVSSNLRCESGDPI
jgi:hypothetical protein